MKALIIVPAYNEAENLPALFRHIKKNCEICDIVVINDCSTDDTKYICEKEQVFCIDLPVNLGIGGAMQTGYKYAYEHGYDAAIQIDGDGQHNPEYIEHFLKEIKKGVDLCIGSRFIDKKGFQSTGIRRIGIRFLIFLIENFSGQKTTDPSSGYRACGKKAIAIFAYDYPSDYPEPVSIVCLARCKMKISEIPVAMDQRTGGKSSITFIRAFYYMIKVSLAVIIASFVGRKEGVIDE